MKSFPKIAVILAMWWLSLSSQIVSAEAPRTVASETKPAIETKEIRENLPHSLLYGLWDTKVHVRLPPLDFDEIQTEDAKQHAREKALRIGIVRQLPLEVGLSEGKSNLGAWKELPNGGYVWRLTIEAPNAIGIRVHLKGLSMSKQCEIVAYNTLDPSQLRGPYTDRSLGKRSEFWTGTIFSETVTVECYCPLDVSPNETALTVDKIVHIYRDPLSMEKEGNCHNDVTCYATWSVEAKGVAGIGTVGGADYIWCTGCLINDRDPGTYIDYFMTANHCVDSQSSADDTEYYWFFQTNTCNGAPPNISSIPSTDGGAAYLAGQTLASGNDFAFLRLRNDSPGGVAYIGWTTGSPLTSETLTGIHHPDGAYKRISFGVLDSSDTNYWDVEWYSGVTEPGSSGSPLFDDSGYFVGQLTGGASSCSNPGGIDYYGRFNVTFPHVQRWLTGTAVALGVAVGNFDGDANEEFAVAETLTDSTLRLTFYDDDGSFIGQAVTGAVREMSLASGNFDSDPQDEVVLACVQADGTLAAIIFEANGTRKSKGVGGQCSNVTVATGQFDSDTYDEYVVTLLQADATLAAISFNHDGTRIGKGVGGLCSDVSVAAGNFRADNDPQDEYVVSLIQSDGTLAAISFYGNGTRIGKGVGGPCINVNIAAGRFAATSPLDGYVVSLNQADDTPAAIFFKADGTRIGKGVGYERVLSTDIACGDIDADTMDEAVLAYINESGQMKWKVFAENGIEVMSGP